jgi:hypothetical protein
VQESKNIKVREMAVIKLLSFDAKIKNLYKSCQSNNRAHKKAFLNIIGRGF